MTANGEIPGQRLLALCSEDWAGAPDRRMTNFEASMLEECLTLGRSSESLVFKSYLARAVRECIVAGNAQLARRLLADEPASDLVLSEVRDIVNKAIDSARPGKNTTSLEDLEFLINHGASISSVDEHGDTPLILACRKGDCNLFKFLIEAGAAGEGCLMDQQNSIGDSDKCSGPALHSPSDLLLAAWKGLLNSEGYAPADYFWKTNLERTWCGIVILLLDQDSTFRSDEPCLVTLLHMACVQGNLAYDRRLLDYGVNISVPADYFKERVDVYGSAIHAAARGGHQDIIELLVSRGAKSNEKLACKLPIPFCWSLWSPLLAPVDIILVCGHDLAICKALGTIMGEYQLLLRDVAVRGNIELVNRLLDVGARLDEVPNTESLEAIQLLRANGSYVHSQRLREYAASCACAQVFRYVVDEFGPPLSTDECLSIAQDLLGRNRSRDPRDMLGVLIGNSGLNVDHVFHDVRNKQTTNLLKIACLEFNWLAVTWLLEEGADPTCPGLPETALDTVRSQAVNLGPLDDRKSHDFDIIVDSLSKNASSTGLNKRAQTLSDSGSSGPASPDAISGIPSSNDDLVSEERDSVPGEIGESFNESDVTPRARPISAMSVPDAYDAFEYEALQDLGAIRVVEIQPSQDSEAFIVCRLIHTNLASRPTYDALSYVWGSQTETNPPSIALNGRKFFIKPSLWTAMHCLRHETKTRVIWIDAICINQSHGLERNQQVSLMGDIYRNARRVFVWLGEEANDSHLVFEQLQVEAQGSYSFSRGSSNFKGRTLRAYEELCRRPWFYRTWVLQEIALSRAATVLCGTRTISFKNFLPTLLPGSDFHPLQGQDFRSHLRKMSELSARGPATRVLSCAMFCHATDLKDKVYGLLGMLDYLDIEVNYDLDITTIFQNFTRAIIQAEGNLKILHRYGTQRLLPSLPTWVQDYSIMSPIGAISGGSNTRRAGRCEYTLTEVDGSTTIWRTSIYPDHIMPGMEFRENALVIRGKRVDCIAASSDELCAHAQYAPGTNKFKEVLRAWETLATELLESKRLPHTVLQALIETLTVEDDAVMTMPPFRGMIEQNR